VTYVGYAVVYAYPGRTPCPVVGFRPKNLVRLTVRNVPDYSGKSAEQGEATKELYRMKHETEMIFEDLIGIAQDKLRHLSAS